MTEQDNTGIVLYRLPDSQTFYYARGKVIQPEKLTLEHKGFVISPFKEGEGQQLSILLPDTTKEISKSDIQDLKFHFSRPFLNHFVDREQYLERIERAKSMFTDDFCKVVLSRRKKVDAFKLSKAPEVFLRLAEAYPGSFIYIFSSEYTGTWGGASPELFLNYNNEEVKTVALAGTIALKDTTEQELAWTEKEVDEQHIVELFIENLLNKNAGSFEKKGPYTQITGSLAHLISRYSAHLPANKLTKLMKELHPTPAVCGLPKKKSYEVIDQIELYNRAYYTGFLGPWNLDDKVHLFVNLRCMQYFNDHAVLYAGGGITSGSDPEKEWEETENKMCSITKVMKSVTGDLSC